MKKKHLLAGILFSSICVAIACNSGTEKENNNSATTTTENPDVSTDPKGVGPHQNVQLTHPLDEKMVAEGQRISSVKCESCHKLTDEKLVGPGWKGVTDRRTPEWIMNFIVNTEEMLQKDTAVQNMLEVCLVKMPNQGLSETDARAVLEFMRKIDGKN
jgi:cytochrome c551/c552